MTHLEDYIRDLLLSINIKKPDQHNIENIASKLRLNIIYDNHAFVFLDEISVAKDTKQQEWQDFGHELCHYLRHRGNQLKMPYLLKDWQENQANYFAYHFCVPTFMLDDLTDLTALKIMNLFNVEYDFALRRLEMYESKVMNRLEIAESKHKYIY